jgi:hypothetical protein
VALAGTKAPVGRGTLGAHEPAPVAPVALLATSAPAAATHAEGVVGVTDGGAHVASVKVEMFTLAQSTPVGRSHVHAPQPRMSTEPA